MNCFNFYEHKAEISKVRVDININVPKNLTQKKLLFDLFSQKLKFPDYFGNNWDALFDCMTDLSFLDEKVICIIHDDIPFANDVHNQKIYVELMVDTANTWLNEQAHQINVYFPVKYLHSVRTILNELN
ncbi:MAG: barstar family protein [Chlamydiales bacterium]|nr:barstar family protein [Chlamydiales bacterium]